MNCKTRSLSLDLHANQFVARYTNDLGNIVVKRFNTQDPDTIYNITSYWRSIDQLEKAHKQEQDELQKHERNHLKKVQY